MLADRCCEVLVGSGRTGVRRRWHAAGVADHDAIPGVTAPPTAARSAEAADWLGGLELWSANWTTARGGAGYQRHARIFHPLDDVPDRQLWCDVARAHDRQLHASATWAGVTDGDEADLSRGYPGEPLVGSLQPVVLGPLCEVLARHTASPDHCWFAVWEGWGWLTDGGEQVLTAVDGRLVRQPVASSRPQLDRRAATFAIPGRRYLLFEGAVGSALNIGHWVTDSWFEPQSPSIFWPADRAWCVSTEVDEDSTLVAGSPELIAKVVADKRLEAVPVDSDVAAPLRDGVNGQ